MSPTLISVFIEPVTEALKRKCSWLVLRLKPRIFTSISITFTNHSTRIIQAVIPHPHPQKKFNTGLPDYKTLISLRAGRQGGFNTGGSESLHVRLDRYRSPPSLLYKESRLSSPEKNWPGRGVDRPPHLYNQCHELLKLYLYSVLSDFMESLNGETYLYLTYTSGEHTASTFRQKTFFEQSLLNFSVRIKVNITKSRRLSATIFVG